MIITKEVEVRIINHNINHYKKFGYDVWYNDILKIPVNHLTLGSHIMIKVKCDNCDNIKEIKYQDYVKIIKKSNEYFCNNCSINRNAKKLGVENISQLQLVKNKKIETNLKNWGTENVFQNEEIKGKSKQTCLEKYGVDSFTKTDEYREKSIKTHIQKRGFEHHMKIDQIFIKSCENSKKSKYYKNILYTASYELDFLKHCESINIFDKISKKYSIPYNFNGKKLLYHPDFYIKEYNLIIEIKSDYYFKKELYKNLAKQQGCIDEGYNFMFIINKDYKLFNCIIKNELLK